MKHVIIKLNFVLFFLGVLFLSGTPAGQVQTAQARQLQGEAAVEFLDQAGILTQLQADMQQQQQQQQTAVDPQGRFFNEPAAFAASDASEDDWLGISVAVSGDSAVVGAMKADVDGNEDQGAAYVFVRGDDGWYQEARLVAKEDGAAEDWFGYSVAVIGDTVVVGAPLAEVNDSTNQGAAYVFVRSAGEWHQQQKLTADDGAPFDLFGISVAVAEELIVVGAEGADVNESNQGAAYLFSFSGRGTDTWNPWQKLVADDGAAEDAFGRSVALSGNTVAVGAPFHEDSRGAAYVFVFSDDTWWQQQKLVADDGTSGDAFGVSLALVEDWLLVGAYRADVEDNANQGAAYIFSRSLGNWNQRQKLVASDGAANDEFGISVALGGDSLAGHTAVVGAHLSDFDQYFDQSQENQGAAYVFVRGGFTFHQQQKLTDINGAAHDRFGRSVALAGDTLVLGAYLANGDGLADSGLLYITERGPVPWPQTDKLGRYFHAVALDGDTAVVGAPFASVNGNTNQGAAYVFVRSGATWSQQQKLIASDGQPRDRFGWSVALDGDSIVVGATYADVNGNTNQGAAYVFVRSGTTWSQQQTLIASDGQLRDRFGELVALDGATIVVGAPEANVNDNSNQGAAYVFVRSGATWSQQQKLVASDGDEHDRFGWSVALDGATIVVGAPGADVNGNPDQGAAYVFVRVGTTWSQQQTLVASDRQPGDWFGDSVALDGATIVVGAPEADVNGNPDQGAAYVFVRSGTTWSQQQKLIASDGDEDDRFGESVALDGATIVVGASGADVNGNIYQGAVYVFVRSGTTWSQQQKLIVSNGYPGDNYGSSVALDGDTAYLAPYIFERQPIP